MSALSPKADMCSALAYVRFVPIADIERLIDRLRLREFPFAVQDFGVWVI
jgi:hypothetical protein